MISIPAKSRGLYAPYFWTLGLLAVSALLGCWFAPERKPVPADLQGLWITSEAAHRDRFLEISSATVTVATGPESVSTGVIRGFEEAPDGPETLYTIRYADDDGDQRLLLYYDPANHLVRFKNQKSISWSKLPIS